MTRDRVAYDASWRGRAFTLVDTGGWEPSVERSRSWPRGWRLRPGSRWRRPTPCFRRRRRGGRDRADAAVAAVLRRSRKPVVLAANKVDDAPGEPAAASLWSLGLGEPFR